MLSKLTLASAALLLALPGGSLATDYAADRRVRFTMESSIETESSTKMERDGQPVEASFGGGSTSNERLISWTDKVLEHKDGVPTKVARVFGDSKMTSSFEMGDRSDSRDQDGALNGVTLELTQGADGVEAKATEGSADGDALTGHSLTHLADLLLEGGSSEAGASWELDNDALQKALGLHLSKAIFPPPPMDESSGGGGGGGDRPRGRSPRGQGSSVLTQIPLEGKATLAEGTEEYEGAACRVIKIEIEGEAALEEPSFGGGRGRAFGIGAFAVVETNAKAKLEGRLLYDEKLKLPVRLELEGTVEVHSERDFEGRDGGSMHMESTQEGEIKIESTLEVVTD